MTTAKRNYIRVNRPAQAGDLVGVRLQPAQLARINAWRAGQPMPLSRPEAMRLLMDLGLDARSRAPSLLDLSDLIFIDGQDRLSPLQDLHAEPEMTSPPPDELWPEDLRDSFIVAAGLPSISSSHEIQTPPKPVPPKPLDRLGPLGPMGRDRKR